MGRKSLNLSEEEMKLRKKEQMKKAYEKRKERKKISGRVENLTAEQLEKKREKDRVEKMTAEQLEIKLKRKNYYERVKTKKQKIMLGLYESGNKIECFDNCDMRKKCLMAWCCVPSCVFTSGNKPKGLSFHSFPNEPTLKEHWITAISSYCVANNIPSWRPAKCASVCSMHFKDTDFSVSTVKRRLLPGAVPSVFLNINKYKFNGRNIPVHKVYKKYTEVYERYRKIEPKTITLSVNSDVNMPVTSSDPGLIIEYPEAVVDCIIKKEEVEESVNFITDNIKQEIVEESMDCIIDNIKEEVVEESVDEMEIPISQWMEPQDYETDPLEIPVVETVAIKKEPNEGSSS